MAAGLCGLRLGVAAFAVAAVAGGFGFLHRRLKHVAFLKGLYVAASWVAVTIALPALLAQPRPDTATVAWSTAIVGAALLANAIATSARDEEAAARVLGRHGALRIARAIAAGGTVVALVAPSPAHHMTAIPLFTVVALAAAATATATSCCSTAPCSPARLWDAALGRPDASLSRITCGGRG